MKIYELFIAQEVNVELDAGTSGTVTFTIDGAVYTATYAASWDATAAAFVAAEDANILAAHNVVLTNPTGAEILFVGADGRIFDFLFTGTVTGDLDGTESGVVVGSFSKLTTSALVDGGNLTIMQITSDNDAFDDDVANSGQYEVLKREVKHESELVTYASDNSLKLNRSDNDGGNVSSLV